MKKILLLGMVLLLIGGCNIDDNALQSSTELLIMHNETCGLMGNIDNKYDCELNPEYALELDEEIAQNKLRDVREGISEYVDNEGVTWKYIRMFYEGRQAITVWENQDTKEEVEVFGYYAPQGRLIMTNPDESNNADIRINVDNYSPDSQILFGSYKPTVAVLTISSNNSDYTLPVKVSLRKDSCTEYDCEDGYVCYDCDGE